MKKKRIISLLFLLSLSLVSAHVSYVLTDEEFSNNLGKDYNFLSQALSSPINLILIAITLIIVSILFLVVPKIKAFKRETKYIEKESKDYLEYIPFLARITLAIALIGAGTSHVFISPSLDSINIISKLQIFIGFLLFIGLFTGFAAWGAATLYLIALIKSPYILGNLDFFGLCLTIIAIGEGKPGVGDLVGIPFIGKLEKIRKYIPQILSVSIGFAMMYLAIYEKILNPHISEIVVTKYALASIIPVSNQMWVFSVGIIEFIVGFLLFIRLKPRLISTIAFGVLSMTFFYFDEAVFSHITLFSTLFIIFVLGSRKFKMNSKTK